MYRLMTITILCTQSCAHCTTPIRYTTQLTASLKKFILCFTVNCLYLGRGPEMSLCLARQSHWLSQTWRKGKRTFLQQPRSSSPKIAHVEYESVTTNMSLTTSLIPRILPVHVKVCVRSNRCFQALLTSDPRI